MKVLTIVVLAVSVVLLGVVIEAATKSSSAIANSLEPPPVKTGAPGETTCASAGCHSGAGSPDGSLFIVFPGGTEYVPNQVYILGVGIEDAGQQRWGFEATALKNSDNTMAGTIVNNMGPYAGTVDDPNGRTYVSHRSNGATTPGNPTDGTFWGTLAAPGSEIGWIFEWTAPPPGAGDVTFYVAAVAADGSQSPDGDYVYLNSITATEGTPTAIEPTTWGQIKKRYR